MVTSTPALTAQVMIDTLKKCGATHLVWLPDTESGYLYKSLNDDPDLSWSRSPARARRSPSRSGCWWAARSRSSASRTPACSSPATRSAASGST